MVRRYFQLTKKGIKRDDNQVLVSHGSSFQSTIAIFVIITRTLLSSVPEFYDVLNT